MKLKRSTENILTIMAPTWMKRLQQAKWDIYKLSQRDRTTIENDANRCFIGEVHCMTNKKYIS